MKVHSLKDFLIKEGIPINFNLTQNNQSDKKIILQRNIEYLTGDKSFKKSLNILEKINDIIQNKDLIYIDKSNLTDKIVLENTSGDDYNKRLLEVLFEPNYYTFFLTPTEN